MSITGIGNQNSFSMPESQIQEHHSIISHRRTHFFTPRSHAKICTSRLLRLEKETGLLSIFGVDCPTCIKTAKHASELLKSTKEIVKKLNHYLPESYKATCPESMLLNRPAKLTHFLRTAYDFSLVQAFGEEAGVPKDASLSEGVQIIRTWIDSPEAQSKTCLILSQRNLLCLPREVLKLRNTTILELSGNHLSSLPSDIGDMSKLIGLIIAGNDLKKLPSAIGKLNHLGNLSFGGNQISELPQWIGGLHELTDLHFTGNLISKLPTEIKNLQNLSDLSASENKLTEVQPEIGSLSHLHILRMDGNCISKVAKEIGNLSQLHLLVLHDNQLETIPPELALLPKQVRISLWNNKFSSEVPQALKLIQNVSMVDDTLDKIRLETDVYAS